jgi:hypothetical protein
MVGAVRSLAASGVLHRFQTHVVQAAAASRSDIFAVLPNSSDAEVRKAQELLHPVVTLGFRSSDCSNPVLRDLCQSLHVKTQHANSAGHLRANSKRDFPHGKLQLFWVLRCIHAVGEYERLLSPALDFGGNRSLSTGADFEYDYILRTRPDVVYLSSMPSLRSLPGSPGARAVYGMRTVGREIPGDWLYLVPGERRHTFMKVLADSLRSPMLVCCGSTAVYEGLRREKVTMEYLNEGYSDLQLALARPCSLHCNHDPRAARTPVNYSTYEQLCHAAAQNMGVFPVTARTLSGQHRHHTDACFDFTIGGGFMHSCCYDEFQATCRKKTAAGRYALGWPADCDSIPAPGPSWAPRSCAFCW